MRIVTVRSAEDLQRAICDGAWLLIDGEYVRPEAIDVIRPIVATGEVAVMLRSGREMRIEAETEIYGVAGMLPRMLSVAQRETPLTIPDPLRYRYIKLTHLEWRESHPTGMRMEWNWLKMRKVGAGAEVLPVAATLSANMLEVGNNPAHLIDGSTETSVKFAGASGQSGFHTASIPHFMMIEMEEAAAWQYLRSEHNSYSATGAKHGHVRVECSLDGVSWFVRHESTATTNIIGERVVEHGSRELFYFD